MYLPRLEIRNIKISIFIKDKLNMSLPRITEYENMIFTIYPHSRKLINVTNLKSIKQLEDIKKVISSQFNVRVDIVRIDSMMLSRKVENRLFSFKETLKSITNQDFKTDNDQELFHAPWVKSKYGSFNLFSNGSVTCMGVKSLEGLLKIESFLNMIYCEENEIKSLL